MITGAEGGGSPVNDDSGTFTLVRVGPRYIVYQGSGDECIADGIDRVDDAAAILAFRDSGQSDGKRNELPRR